MLTDNHIKQLWTRMQAIYGHRWTSGFGETDIDGTWLIGLRDLAPPMIAAGLEACIKLRADSWPPTLPEFRRLCLGLPDIEVACLAALRGASDPVSVFIRRKIGSWDMTHGKESDLLKRARAHYDAACQEATKEKMLALVDFSHNG